VSEEKLVAERAFGHFSEFQQEGGFAVAWCWQREVGAQVCLCQRRRVAPAQQQLLNAANSGKFGCCKHHLCVF